MVDPADLPPDDAFIRTAIRGMQTPEHRESFWDRMARRLDDVDDQRARPGASPIGAPGSLDALEHDPPAARHAARHAARPAARPVAREPQRPQASDHPPRRAPLRAVTPPPTPPVRVHIDAPTASVPAAAAAAAAAPVAAFAGAAAAGPVVRKVADPLARLTVRHDAATLPMSMRRASNAVLLAVAVAAVLVSLFAGLSLVRQRSESGAPAPAEQPAESGDPLEERLAA